MELTALTKLVKVENNFTAKVVGMTEDGKVIEKQTPTHKE